MEVKLNCGDKITIPEGCKAKIENGIITISNEDRTYQDGDVIHCTRELEKEKNEWIAIVKQQEGIYSMTLHALLFTEYVFYRSIPMSFSCLKIYCSKNVACDIRLATEEEKQTLFEALEKKGYAWNAEEKRIEKILPRQKHNSTYYYIGNELKTVYTTESGRPIDYANYAIGNYFLTREEAEEYADKIRELFAERRKI